MAAVRDHIVRARTYVTSSGLGPFVIRSLAGSGIVRAAAMLASFGVGVQLARGLGVTGYGYYGIALSVLTLAGIPGELGVPRLVTREVAAAGARNDLAHLVGVLRWADRTVFRISALMMFGVVAAGLVLAAKQRSALGLSMLFGAPVILFMAFARLKGGALQGLHHIVRGQIPANVFRPLLLSLLLFCASMLHFELSAPLAMGLTALSAAGAALAAHIWLEERLPAAQPAQIVRAGRRWITSSIPMALVDGMRALESELSILLVGLIIAPADAGLFRIASVTAMTAAAPLLIFGHVAMPVIAKLHSEGDWTRLQRAVSAFALGQFGSVLLLTIPLLAIPEPLLRLAFGADFMPAAIPLKIMAIGQIVNVTFGPNAALLAMTNHEQRLTRAVAVAVTLNLLLVPAFLEVWGVAGAAVGFVLSQLCWNVIAWRDARRLLGIETSALLGKLF